MNETTPDAWFYSREGERLGPVTFAELKIKATEAGLNPRLDMVWTHGMPEWKPAGEIEGLFERRTAVEVQEGATSADPYSPPEHESPEELMSQEGEWPGARRRSYLFAILIFPAVWGALVNFGMPFLTTQFGPEIMKFAAPGLAFAPLLVILYFGIQRFANLGMSRWWIFGKFVPVLNFWLGYRSFACPAGYAFHKKLDGVGIFLAIIYWLLVVVLLLAIAAFIALLFGGFGAEAKQQFQDLMQKAIEAQK